MKPEVCWNLYLVFKFYILSWSCFIVGSLVLYNEQYLQPDKYPIKLKFLHLQRIFLHLYTVRNGEKQFSDHLQTGNNKTENM